MFCRLRFLSLHFMIIAIIAFCIDGSKLLTKEVTRLSTSDNEAKKVIIVNASTRHSSHNKICKIRCQYCTVSDSEETLRDFNDSTNIVKTLELQRKEFIQYKCNGRQFIQNYHMTQVTEKEPSSLSPSNNQLVIKKSRTFMNAPFALLGKNVLVIQRIDGNLIGPSLDLYDLNKEEWEKEDQKAQTTIQLHHSPDDEDWGLWRSPTEKQDVLLIIKPQHNLSPKDAEHDDGKKEHVNELSTLVTMSESGYFGYLNWKLLPFNLENLSDYHYIAAYFLGNGHFLKLTVSDCAAKTSQMIKTDQTLLAVQKDYYFYLEKDENENFVAKYLFSKQKDHKSGFCKLCIE